MGFAVERKPKSPIGGMLLIFVGVLFLASRFDHGLNALQIYGRYWILLLVVFGVVEITRHYSHRQTFGPPPRLFSVGRILVLLLIVGSGLVAGRISRNPSVLSALHLSGFSRGLRDSVLGESYSFTDSAPLTSLASGKKIVVENNYGSLRVNGVNGPFRASLAKKVSSWSPEDAQQTADKIKLLIRETAEQVYISTNRDEIQGQFTTDIQLDLPASSPLSINNSYGSVTVSNLESNVSLQASYGDARLDHLSGNVTAQLNSADIAASRIGGNLEATGFKHATVSDVDGSIRLFGKNGAVDLRQVDGAVHVEAPLSRIAAQDLGSPSEIRTEHGSVEITRSSDLTIDAPDSEVRLSEIEGDVKVSSSRKDIRASSVSGDLQVEAEQASVYADDITGESVIQTSRGEVNLRGFHQGARITTSYRTVTLVPAGIPAGDIDVSNQRGDIKLTIPANSRFTVDAQSQSGLVKSVGFGSINARGDSLNAVVGLDGPTIKLRTSYKNIVIQAAGAGQVAATAFVNENR